jgi:hypothetical protein
MEATQETLDPAANGAGDPQVPVGDRPVPSEPRLYTYSAWVHVGPGAQECEAVDEERGENECSNPLHFHAWCRLPNQLQHQEIRERALAAKARRTRQLRDPQSDAYTVLEEEMDQLARVGDVGRQQLIDELVAKEWWRDYLDAGREVTEREDDDGSKPFEHIQADQDRFQKLEAMPEADRPKDEHQELERHLSAFNEAVDEAVKRRQQPRRDALADKDINALVDMVRDDRIANEAQAAFMSTFSQHEWLTGTLTRPGGERVFASIDQLAGAAPEVIDALNDVFGDLERNEREGVVPGNS